MKKAVILFVVFTLSVASLHSQKKLPNKLSKKAQLIYEKKTNAIRTEALTKDQPDWAGEYYFGDGLGVNVDLALAPRNGFTFTWNGCLGLYDLNYGDISVANETITLNFTFPNQREGFQGIEPTLVPIRWGQRHYLIPVNKMLDFANAINSGTEPSDLWGGRSGSFLLKNGDEKNPVEGRPNMPAEYLAYLLEKPVEATITSVGDSHVTESWRYTAVTLNAGTVDGLKKGMEMHVFSPSRTYATATIIGVAEHVADAMLEQFHTSDDPSAPPAPSWKLSTKLAN